ncbi:nucleotide sugar dehydrogenase [Roseovarius sp. S1116L3]|uniref:nucleotide sugar dehydrogenase n=1 Tax=Roseovarius roseus TaxID=3342636 RepID=UPI003729BE98
MADKPFDELLSRIEGLTAKVAILGLGYVGLPLAVTTARSGLHVTGFDIDDKKVDQLYAGHSYIGAVADQDLADLRKAGRVSWTSDFSQLADMDVFVICVPTPLTAHREPDLSYVISTTQEIARHIKQGSLVALESTTYPGTTDEVLTPILAQSGFKLGDDIFIGFSPEREDPGNITYNTNTIPKIVAGDGPEASQLMEAFYRKVVRDVVPVSKTRTAEAIKITENIFRAVNIALVNELKVIFDAMDIDVWEVIDGAATKPFGFMPFYPGPGLGGHCIPIDPFYLTWKAREYHLSTRFIELAGEINSNMPDYVISRLREVIDRRLGIGLSKARILIIGIAYKKNVSDMRESPAVRLLSLLRDAGASVQFHDPHVPQIPRMREYPELLGYKSTAFQNIDPAELDAILIATDHDNVDYAALAEMNLPIIDTRNAMQKRNLAMDNVEKA